MNKTVIKDILREITVNKSRFLSIMALLFISMVAFSGIFMATILLEQTPEQNYIETNLHDLKVTSTLGLSDQDEFLIGTNLDVEDFEMSKFIDVIDEDTAEIVRIENVPEKISTLILKEGNLPKNPDEIVLDFNYYNELYKIGDNISFVDSDNSSEIDNLNRNEFKIVGFVNSVEYLTEEVREISTIGSGSISTYGYILSEVFDMNYYTKAKIKGRGLSNYSSFSTEYSDGAEKIRLSLEETFEDRPKERVEEVTEDSLKEIKEAELELEDAREELEKAKRELEDARREIEEARVDLEEGDSELQRGERDLEDARIEILESEVKIRESEIEIKEGEVELQKGEVDLKQARAELNTGWSEYEKGLKELNDNEQRARREIEYGKRDLEKARVEIEDGQRQLDEGKKELERARAELNKGKEEFQKGEALYLENLKVYEDGVRELNEQKEKIRISEEIRLGELNKEKNKDKLQSTINKLTGEINNHEQNLNNYNAQLQYNKSILNESEEKERVQEKINELNALIESENGNLNRKTKELNNAKDALANFNKVNQEGPVSEDVIKYSGEAIEQAERQLRDAKTQLDGAKAEIEKGRAELQKGIEEFEAGERELLESQRKLEEGRKKYNEGLAELEEGEKTLNRELEKGRRDLAQGKLDLEEGERQYNQGISELRDAKRQLEDGKVQLEEGKVQLEEGKIKYQDGIKELEKARIDLEEGRIELEEGIEEFEEGEKEFKVETQDALESIEEGEAEIKDAKEEILKLKEPTFMIDTRNSDSTYYTINGFPGSLKILAVVFSTLALLISLLVAFTTMTRMVDERRILIGTYKGLGHENSVIAAKFVLFGGISGLTGTIVGTILGQFVLAPIIYEIYMDGLLFSEPLKLYSVELLIAGLVMALITTSLSAYLAVNKTLKENAASLLRPKAPKSGSRILIERIKPIWSRLKFMDKITARNIFRYKGRMAMTIIGVAVCMSLMILGFGMKYSISNVAQLQFGELQQFDLILSIQEDLDDEDLNEAVSFIREHDNVDKIAQINITPLKLQIPGENTQDVNLFVDMDGNVNDLVNFRIRNTDTYYELNDEGIIVTEKLADLMNLTVGSSLNVEIDNQDVELVVNGISENYLGHYIYMNSEYYQKVMGEVPYITGSFVSLLNKDADSVDETSTDLLTNDNILSSISSRDSEELMKATVDSIDVVIIIIVLIAMLLALVVLYNLTNINISERIRELSTMKVLGFYPKELTEYVYKETFILSGIGIIFGMILGLVIVDFVIREFAPLNIMFGNPNYPVSFSVSAAFTIIFTLIVMVLMHYKLKSIDMVEALKSVD